jgi:hypothetical protein
LVTGRPRSHLDYSRQQPGASSSSAPASAAGDLAALQQRCSQLEDQLDKQEKVIKFLQQQQAAGTGGAATAGSSCGGAAAGDDWELQAGGGNVRRLQVRGF